MSEQRRKGIGALDGKAEVASDLDEVYLPPPIEPDKRRLPDDVWPVLTFDIALMANPDADQEARDREWSRVYQHFDPFLRYYFEDVMGYSDADEIVAAVWRRALRKISSLDAPENAWWWLIRVGRNYFLDDWRKGTRRMKRDRKGLDQMTEDDGEDWRDRVLDEISQETKFQDKIDLNEFRAAFAALSAQDQEFVYLLKLHELSHEEVVKRLRLKSPQASRQRWSWIKKKLIQRLSG
ncbi:MAG TPA: sigma-70 family RNA polymerase sigma factor [Gemmatimonadaceae bacterium]|nr:sigma-70 family RNA polymerase sigma factor [Gemmatimonadaceae bacterium]